MPENVSEAGSLVEAPAEPVEEKAVAETNGAEVAPGLNEYYMALYQYASNESGDLNFNGGDVILVIKKDGDWWTGVIGDRTGIFPSNYVEKYDAPQVSLNLENLNHFFALNVLQIICPCAVLGVN